MNSRMDLQSPRVRTALWVIGCTSAVALIIAGIYLGLAIYDLADATRQTQVTNTEKQEQDRERDRQTAQTARDAARSAERIEDCTTPGRPCFERNSRATSNAVAGINQGTLAVIVATISCQEDGITEVAPLSRCAAERAAASSVKVDQQPQEN